MFLVRILSLRLSITSKLIRNQLLMKAYCNSNHDDDEPEVFTGPIPRGRLKCNGTSQCDIEIFDMSY
jgi:hypothetical protein